MSLLKASQELIAEWEQRLEDSGLGKPDAISREGYLWTFARKPNGENDEYSGDSYLYHLAHVPAKCCFRQGLAVKVIVMSHQQLAALTHQPVVLCPSHSLGMGVHTKGYSPKQIAAECGERFKGTFFFITPDGEKLTIVNLKEYCRQNKLCYTLMKDVGTGAKVQYKGWRSATATPKLCACGNPIGKASQLCKTCSNRLRRAPRVLNAVWVLQPIKHQHVIGKQLVMRATA